MSEAYESSLNKFEDFARQVSNAKTLNDKKMAALEALKHMKYKEKIQIFENDIRKITNCNKLDMLMWNLVLLETGDRVVQPLKR